jgi:hypothetical protein
MVFSLLLIWTFLYFIATLNLLNSRLPNSIFYFKLNTPYEKNRTLFGDFTE